MEKSTSSDVREFIGVTLNENILYGKVVGDLTEFENSNGPGIFFRLRTNNNIFENGEWNRVPVDVPIYVVRTNLLDAIRKHVSEGRKMVVFSTYRNWTKPDGQPGHGFFVDRFELGSKPFKREEKQSGGFDDIPA